MRTNMKKAAVASALALVAGLGVGGHASADNGAAGNAGCLFQWANSAGYDTSGQWLSAANTYSNPSPGGCNGTRVRQRRTNGTFTSWKYDTVGSDYFAWDSCTCVVNQTQHSGRAISNGVWYTWIDN